MSTYMQATIGNYAATEDDEQRSVSFGSFETATETMDDLRAHAEASWALLDRDDI